MFAKEFTSKISVADSILVIIQLKYLSRVKETLMKYYSRYMLKQINYTREIAKKI